MSNLSNRVQKSKKLDVTPYSKKGLFWTKGSKGETYWIKLESKSEVISTPDGSISVPVFYTSCKKLVRVISEVKNDVAIGDRVNPHLENRLRSRTVKQNKTEYHNCKGNERHTICYHCLGALRESFSQVGKTISFYETYHQAMNGLNFGGFSAKVQSTQGNGVIWSVVRDKPENNILSVEENINLMRGSEDDEGID